jgi:type VI secretion system protein ImpF
MAELLPQERLQPSLLDRLTDDAPESKDESRDKRVLNLAQLRAGVMRDLSWLLNTVHL